MSRIALLLASSALALAVADPATASTCQLGKIAEWPLRIERNKLIVDGAVNGQKVGVLIDTGATTTLILRPAAIRLGLTRHDVRRTRIFGVGGESNVEYSIVDEFRVGETVRKNWRVLVAGERDIGSDVAVILGEDFLQAVDVEFDLAHRKLRLFQPTGCEGVSLAYWASAGAGEVEFEPLEASRSQIVVPIRINDQPLKAMLDSGASVSILDKADAERLGVTPRTPGVVPVGAGVGLGAKSIDTWIGPFRSFTIGDETIRDTELRFTDWHANASYVYTGSRLRTQLQGLSSMLLGADFLRAHRLLIAHSQRKIYFTYTGGPIFQLNRPPPPADAPGEGKATPAKEN